MIEHKHYRHHRYGGTKKAARFCTLGTRRKDVRAKKLRIIQACA